MRLSSFLSFSVLNAANLPGHDIKKMDLTNSQLADIKEKYCFRQAQTGGRDSVCEKDDEIPDWIWEIHFASVQYCKDFYRDFHGVEDPRKTSNRFLAAGGQGMVSVCGPRRTDSRLLLVAYSTLRTPIFRYTNVVHLRKMLNQKWLHQSFTTPPMIKT